MKPKNNANFNRLTSNIENKKLVDEVLQRLNSMENRISHQFVQYLESTFRQDESPLALEHLIKLSEEDWITIADQQSGGDAFDRESKIRTIFENSIADQEDEELEQGNDIINFGETMHKKFLQILHAGKLDDLGLTMIQSLTVKLLYFVFEGNYSATASLLGVSRQAVRKCVTQAIEKIKH